MAGKMSNRDRIAQLAAEAKEGERQKAAAKEAKPKKAAKAGKSTGTGKAKPRATGRIKIVWVVCGPSGNELEVFPYAQEPDARTKAEQLTAGTGRSHFVRRAEVPVRE